MHYRNGREAKNGDKIISLMSGSIDAVGILRDATPGNDYCNGNIQTGHEPSTSDPLACMCDCLHVDDVIAILAEKGFDKRQRHVTPAIDKRQRHGSGFDDMDDDIPF